ncbi:hypothetical protein E0485_04705 [Paenibacillus albiflavus]|uniref:Asp/Glu/hydantoin racemase n=1 Tax=Paenibacillus albiflavus TaxID=2545760 RepID=A0A4R4EKW9_9BACL|nr:hypothetical protein [Paenibacillus albiflavus]TCZ80153.1 hypothetical protein E0485_04705 [Paenibacillus albiflavus]
MLRIGCYHAHYSNIDHIERVFESLEVELIHFVDPGLDRRKNDVDFSSDTVRHKVHETLEWIAKCHVDVILVTCTFFTAAIEADHIHQIPIVKIDTPLFNRITQSESPAVLVFTNPNTAQGTVEQMNRFMRKNGKEVPIESITIDHAFELIMQGKKEDYFAVVSSGLQQIAEENQGKLIIAAQLSMVSAAEMVQQQSGFQIVHSLCNLIPYMSGILDIEYSKL